MYYYGYRWYDPVTGRWVSRDRIGERGGLNLLAIAGNRLLSAIDRLGLVGICCSCSDCHVEQLRIGILGTLGATTARIDQAIRGYKNVETANGLSDLAKIGAKAAAGATIAKGLADALDEVTGQTLQATSPSTQTTNAWGSPTEGLATLADKYAKQQEALLDFFEELPGSGPGLPGSGPGGQRRYEIAVQVGWTEKCAFSEPETKAEWIRYEIAGPKNDTRSAIANDKQFIQETKDESLQRLCPKDCKRRKQ